MVTGFKISVFSIMCSVKFVVLDLQSAFLILKIAVNNLNKNVIISTWELIFLLLNFIES